MITFFHKNGNAQATIDSDGIIKYCVTGDDFLLQLLQSEYSKGVPTLQEFAQTGIPGKIKGYQEVKETKDLITILKLVQEKYQNFNIIIEHEERKNPIKQKYTLLK